MEVKKSDGTFEEFDEGKIKIGVENAYKQCGQECPEGLTMTIVNSMTLFDKMESWEIRRQVEELLMSFNKQVARAYISKYKENDTKMSMLKSQKDFIQKYIGAINAATGSKYDANANVSAKNIATLNAEIPKQRNIMFNRYNTKDKIASMYSKKLAAQYDEDLKNHIVYKHDESTFGVNSPYCVAVQSYPFLIGGIKDLGGLSGSPQNIDSFCGMFVNWVFAVSSQFAGAVAVSGTFVMMDYFCRKEWGDDWYEHLEDRVARIKYKDGAEVKCMIGRQLEQYFQEIVYSINQPSGARGFQSPFTNFAYFDKPYFDGLYGHYVYPDGMKPQWDSISCLQKLFMNWLNNERTKTVLTFPVETMSLLYKDGKFVDEEYADFVAGMYAKGHSFFTYISDSPDTLSSCCFSSDTNVLWRSAKHGICLSTFKEMYDCCNGDDESSDIEVWHNTGWALCHPVKLPNRAMYKVVTENDKVIKMTDNHINLTLEGEKTTDKLTTNDYLLFSDNNDNNKVDKDDIRYLEGMFVGWFLCNGQIVEDEEESFWFKNDVDDIKYKRSLYLIHKLTSKYGIIQHTVDVVASYDKIVSKKLKSLASEYIEFENNEYKVDKFNECKEFAHGIIDGINEFASSELKSSVQDFVDVFKVVNNINTPSECALEKDGKVYYKVKSVEVIPYYGDVYCIERYDVTDPYFTLPNGLITHNCRLSNKITENTFCMTNGLTGESTGSKSVITLNYNRIIQNFVREAFNGDRDCYKNNREEFEAKYREYITPILERVYKYHTAYNEILWDLYKAEMLPVYSAGYISLNQQYLTLGLNGFNEAWMYLGGECRYNEDYIRFCQLVCGTMKEQNQLHKTKKTMFNTEFVPAESLGVKNYKWDKAEGYWVPEGRNCYTSYFFLPDDQEVDVLEKMLLHSKKFVENLDGGSACHINLAEHLSKEQYRYLLNFAGENGTNYFTFNVRNTACNNCGYISKHTLKTCPKCGSNDIDYLTRIIGYLKRIRNFSQPRQIEAENRVYS